jgi:hypothetical protein
MTVQQIHNIKTLIFLNLKLLFLAQLYYYTLILYYSL